MNYQYPRYEVWHDVQPQNESIFKGKGQMREYKIERNNSFLTMKAHLMYQDPTTYLGFLSLSTMTPLSCT